MVFRRSIFLWFLGFTSVLAQDWQNPEYIENAFIEVALKTEYRPHQNRLLKWETPILYRTIYNQIDVYPPLEKMIQIHFQHLSEITGFPIHQASKEAENFEIVMTKDKDYQEMINRYAPSQQKGLSRSSNCMAQIQSNITGTITHAVVIIPIDHATSRGLLAACVVEELTQAMGLPNDSDWVHPSIANDKSLIELLTGLDYLFLKLLYLPELKPGMTEKQVRDIIHPKILDMQKNKVIEQAPKKVNQSGLYRYLN